MKTLTTNQQIQLKLRAAAYISTHIPTFRGYLNQEELTITQHTPGLTIIEAHIYTSTNIYPGYNLIVKLFTNHTTHTLS